MKTMLYKGFAGTVEYSEEDGCFFGKVLENGNNLVAYEGQTEEELRKDFEEAVEGILLFNIVDNLYSGSPYRVKR